jgi:hypothetical protein
MLQGKHAAGLKMGVEPFAAFVAALLLIASASARAGNGEGIAFYFENKPAMLRTTAKLKVGDTLVMQYPGPNRELTCCIGATVTGKIAQAALVPIYNQDGIAKENVSDMLRDADVRGYRIKLQSKKAFAKNFDAAAVIAPKLAVRQLSPKHLEIGTGLHSTKVENCFSQEGRHLITHKAGKVRRHLYAHFGGSDEELTCSADVWKLVGME